MAGRRGGGGRSRMDLRREADALEAREREGAAETEETEDEDEDEEDEDEEGDDAEGEADEGGDDEDGGDEDDEDAPKKKKAKKKAAPKAKAPAKKRTRAVKEVRMRATWVVFDNAQKRVGVFPYSQKKEAEELLAAKIEEKKTTFYLQLVKEAIEE